MKGPEVPTGFLSVFLIHLAELEKINGSGLRQRVALDFSLFFPSNCGAIHENAGMLRRTILPIGRFPWPFAYRIGQC
jgi:hypothetical protein